MTEHTPGPWTAEIGTDGVPAASNLRTEVRAGREYIARTDPQSLSGRSNTSRVDQEANARLIAAAPDLLAALEDMLGQYEDEVSREVGWRKRMHDGARAAIAKARGIEVAS